jgi:hypothetical protein
MIDSCWARYCHYAENHAPPNVNDPGVNAGNFGHYCKDMTRRNGQPHHCKC